MSLKLRGEPCKNKCGYGGHSKWKGYCSPCYHEVFQEEVEQLKKKELLRTSKRLSVEDLASLQSQEQMEAPAADIKESDESRERTSKSFQTIVKTDGADQEDEGAMFVAGSALDKRLLIDCKRSLKETKILSYRDEGESNNHLSSAETFPDDSGTDYSTSDDSDGEPWISEYPRLSMRKTMRRKIRARMTNKNAYPMSQPIRGRALILHMECFDTALNEGQENLDRREGSEVDCKHITKLLTDLGFDTRKCEDLSSQRIKDEIRDETQHPDHEKYGMFVLIILSHGDQNMFYGSDGRPVHHDDLYSILSPKKFTAMAGKPKWIIMQTCSGDKIDKHMIQTDDVPPPYRLVKKVDRNTSSVTDMIMFKASFPGYRSARHIKYGSCFIKLLVELFYKHACHSDILTLARMLRRRVLKETENVEQPDIGSQTVTVIETLHNELYLFPLYNPNIC